MKCVSCGAELPEGSLFCVSCGASQQNNARTETGETVEATVIEPVELEKEIPSQKEEQTYYNQNNANQYNGQEQYSYGQNQQYQGQQPYGQNQPYQGQQPYGQSQSYQGQQPYGQSQPYQGQQSYVPQNYNNGYNNGYQNGYGQPYQGGYPQVVVANQRMIDPALEAEKAYRKKVFPFKLTPSILHILELGIALFAAIFVLAASSELNDEFAAVMGLLLFVAMGLGFVGMILGFALPAKGGVIANLITSVLYLVPTCIACLSLWSTKDQYRYYYRRNVEEYMTLAYSFCGILLFIEFVCMVLCIIGLARKREQ